MRSGHLLIAAFGVLLGFRNETAAEEKDALINPLFSLTGPTSKVTKGGCHRIESAKAWEALWLQHHTGKPERLTTEPIPPQFAKVDFEKCMVIAVFQGAFVNCNGYEVYSISEEKDRLLVRIKGKHFQTIGSFEKTSAWGMFVLSKSAKPVVIELDTKSLVADPPRWTLKAELKPGDSTSGK